MRKIRTVSRQIQRQRGKVSPRFPSASLFSTPLHSTPKEQTWVLVYFLSGLKWHKLVLISCISCYPKKSRLSKGKYYFSLTTYEVQRKWSNFPKGTIQWMVKTQTQVHPILQPELFLIPNAGVSQPKSTGPPDQSFIPVESVLRARAISDSKEQLYLG